MPAINSQLDDIHAMLPSGKRSIRLEPHTLIILAIAGVLVNIIDELFLTNEIIESDIHRLLAEALLYTVALTMAWFVDHRVMLRHLRERDEPMSFVHRQIRKVVYLLFGLMVIYIVGISYAGGSAINFFVIWALFGLTMFIYGLFSEELLCWFGIFCITMGYFTVAFDVPDQAVRFLCISIFAIGMPALAWLLSRQPLNRSMGRKIWVSGFWLTVVIAPATLAYQIEQSISYGEPPDSRIPLVSLETYSQQTTVNENRIIRIPSGTAVPLRFHLTGVFFDEMTTTTAAPVVLSRSIDLVMEDGGISPWYRIDGGRWQNARNIRVPNHGRLLGRALSRDEVLVLNYDLVINTLD